MFDPKYVEHLSLYIELRTSNVEQSIMVRNLASLSSRTYDVVVIGGGIYGVCIAWDACQRGLSVALVDKGDFGGATSSNSLRVIHGGLRYLQQGDIRRVRRSIYERTAFMRIAPHLVQPLPILIPTYGRSLRGKQIFSLALLLNKLIGFDLNGRDFPSSRIVSKQECLRLFPGVNERGLTGGVIVYDCQMSNSERLVLSFAQSAAKAGAELANYVECTDLLNSGGRINGIKSRDVLTGDDFIISGRVVVNASGPWIDHVLAPLNGARLKSRSPFSKAFNLLINRQLIPDQGVGVYSQSTYKDRDAIVHKGSRLFFIMPWQGRSLIGTAHLPYDGQPENSRVTATEVQNFVHEINKAYPIAALKPADIEHVYSGLLPVVEPGGVQLVRHHRIRDHYEEDRVDGLISVNGVKFTEARYVAEKAVDAVFSKLAKKPPKSMTAVTPLDDGQVRTSSDYDDQATRRKLPELSTEIVRLLISHYGSAYLKVLECRDHNTDSCESMSDMSYLIDAEVRYAIKMEMAQKLADVVFRRTTLGQAGKLTERSLGLAAAVMGRELGWSEETIAREMEEVRAVLPHIAFKRGKAA
jgi:glycerol-3-phosphate dehydrogenase